MTISNTSRNPQTVDFFISYTGNDEAWARWIAWEPALVGSDNETREVKKRPDWPGNAVETSKPKPPSFTSSQSDTELLRVQFIACDVARGARSTINLSSRPHNQLLGSHGEEDTLFGS